MKGPHIIILPSRDRFSPCPHIIRITLDSSSQQSVPSLNDNL